MTSSKNDWRLCFQRGWQLASKLSAAVQKCQGLLDVLRAHVSGQEKVRTLKESLLTLLGVIQ